MQSKIDYPLNFVKLINATGVVVHTNLGRSPLSREVAQRIFEAAISYSNLEYDLEKGRRGQRNAHLRSLMEELTGAEAVLAVNNNAAAVLLALGSIAKGREVIVSRGELIEIGGSFRIPEVMAQSGAVLREVGTTNRTHPRDYVRGHKRKYCSYSKSSYEQLQNCRIYTRNIFGGTDSNRQRLRTAYNDGPGKRVSR